MRFRSGLTGCLLALACAGSGLAQTSTTLPVKNGAGASVSIAGQSDSGSAFHYRDLMEGLQTSGAPLAFYTDASGFMHVVIEANTLPSGAATSANQATANTSLSTIASNTTGLATATNQATANGSLASIVTNTAAGATAANQGSQITQETAVNTNMGAPGATVCATDNGSCSMNALLQRNNQRITSLIGAVGSPLQAGGSVGISGTLPAFASTPTVNLGTLNGAATAAKQPALGTAGAASTDVLSVQGIASGTPMNASPDSVVDGAAFSGSVSSGATIVTVNTTGYSYLAFQFTSVGAGNTFVAESSNDGTPGTGSTFAATLFYLSNTTAAYLIANAPQSGFLYIVPVTGSTMRIRVSSYGSGTVTLSGVMKRYGALPAPTYSITSSNVLVVGGNVASGAADSGSPMKVGCKFNSAVQAFTTGNRTDCQSTPTGAELVEEAGRSYSNITTNATTTVKSGAGFLHTLCINTKGASANTATVYDNTTATGTKIATLDTTGSVGCLTYDVAFATGLTIVTATGTAPDLTASYR